MIPLHAYYALTSIRYLPNAMITYLSLSMDSVDMWETKNQAYIYYPTLPTQHHWLNTIYRIQKKQKNN